MTVATAGPRSALSYYTSTLVVTAGCVLGAGLAFGWAAAVLVLALCGLEIGLSMDNAIVNAKILENWDERWRKIFLRWGILIAVFGMRLVFPIVIVCITTGLGPVEVGRMALFNQEEYARQMLLAEYQIHGFGGAFLMMVALGFFFGEKHVHWLEWVESKLTRFGQIEGVSAAITVGALLVANQWIPQANRYEFLVAGVLGMAAYVCAHGLGTLVGGEEDPEADAGDGTSPAGKYIRAGAAGFLYIEILDASFSFDGVIGAFALTTYLPIIMLGLGAGAFAVRSATIHLVETGTLAEYRYLEHGAFYAILVLALIMLAPTLHLPEWLVGISGLAVLGAALLHSHLANQRDAAEPTADAPAAAA